MMRAVTGAGFPLNYTGTQAMKILTLVEANRPGLLAEVATRLEQLGVNVLNINVQAVGEQAVISLQAEPWERCHALLIEAGYDVFTADHLLLRVRDQPGALAEISRRLANAEVDIRNVHVVHRDGSYSILAVETDNPYRAGQVLQDLCVTDTV